MTAKFVAAYKAGNDDEARAIYPVARLHWERIETIAESFGDLDPKLDLREADLEPGQKWTGWHRLEKDLWPARAKNYRALSDAQRAAYSADLVKNTAILYERTRDLTFTVGEIANGSRGLLDEVATGKVTGEEEYWSRTDLWDFQANIEGALVGFEGLRPVLQHRDPELDQQIAVKFVAVQALLDAQRVGAGFKSYDELTQAEVKELSDAVNALSEPLSKLACRSGLGLESEAMTTTQHLREKPNETEALAPPPAEPPVRRSAVSRRGLLGAAGVGLAGLAAGAAGGFALGSEQPAPTQAPMPGLRTYPFYGQHQAGILTPMQDRLHFAAFDVITESREELVQLLKDWTAAAARMTQGLAAGEFGPTSGPYAAPPDDTGEAIGLPPGV
jgi:hypothetical protein